MLLAIAIIHILPETNEVYEGLKAHEMEAEEKGHVEGLEEEHEEGHPFPLPFVLFVVGFMFLLSMDQILFKS